MNKKIKMLISRTKKSIYTISKETGIPYTTLCELVNGKTNINKCSSETVFLLSLYLKCSVGDLINEFPLIKGVSGKYKGIKYYWKYDEKNKMELHILQNKKDIIIDSGSMFSEPQFYSETRGMTELLMDYYLEEQEVQSTFYD